MSTILYYSNYCENCKRLLSMISKSPIKDDMHFICIDKRKKGNDGATYIILQNGQDVLLPPTVSKVPALLLLNRGHQVLFEQDIVNYVQPQIETSKKSAVLVNGEPSAYALGGFGSCFGVASDSYSYLDQTSDEMSAKGDGGMRQTHHYASIQYKDNIVTPPDNYSADTIGNISMETLQQQRMSDIRQTKH